MQRRTLESLNAEVCTEVVSPRTRRGPKLTYSTSLSIATIDDRLALAESIGSALVDGLWRPVSLPWLGFGLGSRSGWRLAGDVVVGLHFTGRPINVSHRIVR